MVCEASGDFLRLPSHQSAQRRAYNQLLLELFVEDSWRRVHAGELEVRPPAAPTTRRLLGVIRRERQVARDEDAAYKPGPIDSKAWAVVVPVVVFLGLMSALSSYL
jgi:hypothetical protein